MTSPTSSTNLRSHSATCRAAAATSGFRPPSVVRRRTTSPGKTALRSGCHLPTVSPSMSTNAVLRVEQEPIEFSSIGDRVCRDLLERFEVRRPVASSSLVDFAVVAVGVLAFVLRRFRSEELRRPHLIAGGGTLSDMTLFSYQIKIN